MPFNNCEYDDLTKTLTENFNFLADEVQLLSDRKIVLEHKLRYAHEQYQYLADKYARADSEISSTLAKLQLPPDLRVFAPDRAGFVPLPRRQTHSKQHTAVVIRDGRRASQRLAALSRISAGSTASGLSISGTSSDMRSSARRTSLSTVLEQDFTVQGKKSSLLCPFAVPDDPKSQKNENAQFSTMNSGRPLTPSDTKDPTRHQSADPICAALYAETMNSPPPSVAGSAAKCPIRFLDQHSPEEVARYFETHKHEIPRSHEVCVKRYQRNEEDIKKLDAKYGNLVSMIQGLGQKHQPMLPTKEEEEAMEMERTSNERVENWANAVSVDGVEGEDEPTPEDDRESRFDRPMKEVRVGESPSRPWGISVPIFDGFSEPRPLSPPPAPVSAAVAPLPPNVCPFGHGQAKEVNPDVKAERTQDSRPAGKCPFGHDLAKVQTSLEVEPKLESKPSGKCTFGHDQVKEKDVPYEEPSVAQPTFIQPNDFARMGSSNGPQMIFTGPVFIGYPMDQAMAFMKQFSGQNE